MKKKLLTLFTVTALLFSLAITSFAVAFRSAPAGTVFYFNGNPSTVVITAATGNTHGDAGVMQCYNEAMNIIYAEALNTIVLIGWELPSVTPTGYDNAYYLLLPYVPQDVPQEDNTEWRTYWDGVLKAVKNAKDGDVIDTDPKYLDNMPVEIMEELLNCTKSITLRLHYQGEEININADEAVTPELGVRSTYSLQELLLSYRGKKATAAKPAPSEEPAPSVHPTPTPETTATPQPTTASSAQPTAAPSAAPTTAPTDTAPKSSFPTVPVAAGAAVVIAAAVILSKKKKSNG